MDPNEANFEMSALLKGDDRSSHSSDEARTPEDYEFVDDEHPDVRERKLARINPQDDSLASFYKPVESYEGRHRFDPHFQWEPAAEKKVVRKVRVCMFDLY